MTRKLYAQLASSVQARANCADGQNNEWYDRHERTVLDLVDNFLPHGSGIDSDLEFDFETSTGEKLVINGSYHAMDENGMYDGWIDFLVTVRPSLQFGFDLNVQFTGANSRAYRKYGDVREYLHEIFDGALHQNIAWVPENDPNGQYVAAED